MTVSAYGQNVSLLPHQDLPFPNGGCCSIVSGDFNGDGKQDLVVTDGKSELTLMLGKGNGTFISKSLGVLGNDYHLVATADFNRDGKLDLLITNSISNYVLFGNGDGSFQRSLFLYIGGVKLVADVDGDGILDLLIHGRDYSGENFTVSFGNGDGTFRQSTTIQHFKEGFVQFAVAADFNGDGKLDVAWSRSYHDGNFVDIWLGNGDGSFRQGTGVDTEDYYSRKPMVVADFNHDGKMDLAIYLGENPGLDVRLGNGDGTFRPGFKMPIATIGRISQYDNLGIVLADFNGDGKIDVAIGSVIILGNGDGTFQAPAYFPDGHGNEKVAIAADFNGDGLPDLVLSQGLSSFSLRFNNSPGNFTSFGAVSAVNGAGAISSGSIASIYGLHLAPSTMTAPAGALLEQLNGVRLRIRDSLNVTRFVSLFFVSPTQINFLVPDGIALGWAYLTIDNGTTPLVESTRATVIGRAPPGFFTVGGRGSRVPAATAVRVLADGSQKPVVVFSCTGDGSCVDEPMDLNTGDVYLSLYGTGFRAYGMSPGECRTGEDISLRVTFKGRHPTLPGLDQVNLLLPKSLRRGIVNVECRYVYDYTDPVQVLIN